MRWAGAKVGRLFKLSTGLESWQNRGQMRPCVDIGTAAVETMVSRIKHPEMAARAVRVQGNLVVRESTGVSD